MIKPSQLNSVAGIKAYFFGRKGGVSEGIYESLNRGYGSGDDIDKVHQNRKIVAKSLGPEAEDIHTLKQVHSAKVVVIEEPYNWQNSPEADAIVTTQKNLVIGILTADCVPILMADKTGSIVAAIHAGWKGAIGGVIQNTIATMEGMGFKPESLIAVIGPAISQGSYEVSDDVRDKFIEQSPKNSSFFQPNSNSKYQFNLKAYVQDIIRLSGIADVSDVNVDTYANDADYFSFRRTTHRSEKVYGRRVAAIVIV